MMLPMLLTVGGVLLCAACIGGLAFLLSWRELAPTPLERARRLYVAVLPGASVLLGLLVWTLLHVMLLWAPGASPAVAVGP
jgi:membrane protein implicated in regulation of membrane protease activity